VKFHLTRVSRNRKTGPIPVATSSRNTCPDSCPLMRRGCYADSGPLRIHWDRVSKTGVAFDEFLRQIARLPRNQLWRYGQAGDLPQLREDVLRLAKANGRRPVIAYTHHRDIDGYREAERHGFHINLSADDLGEADLLKQTGLSVVVVLPTEYGRRANEPMGDYRDRMGGKLSLKTPGGAPVAICPATYTDTDCARCRACAKPRPGGTIIGFPAHGSRRNLIAPGDRSQTEASPAYAQILQKEGQTRAHRRPIPIQLATPASHAEL
jgi:hypothetical protein